MTALVFQLVGGIGLFLLGMVLLTDGLRTFAGEALRRMLVQFTGTPLKAFGSGTLVTALVQSSSATTVAVIGFVSAGLLTFPQSVGVVLGASLGTTATGWIVSVLGLTVSVGLYALPLVGAGAFLRLLAAGRARSLGLAMAGFGLIFVGIEILQEGMRGLSGLFNLADLPQAGFGAHLLGMLIGTGMTVVMQSSSAAVATTLTALHTGAVSFDQAATLVIGAAVGTTVTGAIAAIGATIPARRTALAHVLFNLATGLVAVVLLPVLLWVIRRAQNLGLEPGAMSLAAFHSIFIGAGVALFLPFARPFAAWIERRLPDRGPRLTRHLDPTLLAVPPVALEATRRALTDTACELLNALRAALDGRSENDLALRRAALDEALDEIERFFATIPAESESTPSASRVGQMHAIDHLLRLRPRLWPPAALRRRPVDEPLRPALEQTVRMLESAQAGLRGQVSEGWLDAVRAQAQALSELRQRERPIVMRQAVGGRWGPGGALEVLDAMRWLERVAYHAWRVCNYLADGEEAQRSAAAPSAEATPEKNRG